MPLDPMTSAEQAEAEADERFFEERDDDLERLDVEREDDYGGAEIPDPCDEQEERRKASAQRVTQRAGTERQECERESQARIQQSLKR